MVVDRLWDVESAASDGVCKPLLQDHHETGQKGTVCWETHRVRKQDQRRRREQVRPANDARGGNPRRKRARC